ncbi:unnamed protein product [Dovyalis caffra]|uniref:Uncharacterized protein n=1 Tax=Dovyalis caffra TaxID=77055 RepID=A0AAV1QMW0_9ROSI|nr:unnamed protein product [Dovyalis caffra]
MGVVGCGVVCDEIPASERVLMQRGVARGELGAANGDGICLGQLPVREGEGYVGASMLGALKKARVAYRRGAASGRWVGLLQRRLARHVRRLGMGLARERGLAR